MAYHTVKGDLGMVKGSLPGVLFFKKSVGRGAFIRGAFITTYMVFIMKSRITVFFFFIFCSNLYIYIDILYAYGFKYIFHPRKAKLGNYGGGGRVFSGQLTSKRDLSILEVPSWEVVYFILEWPL